MPSSALKIRRPPRSTPFPYTTLCRSVGAPIGSCSHPGRPRERRAAVHGRRRAGAPSAHGSSSCLRPSPRAHQSDSRSHAEGRAASRDRKSTRLNSSHANISYAVFCFKNTATTEIYTLSLHDALPICGSSYRIVLAPGSASRTTSGCSRSATRWGSIGAREFELSTTITTRASIRQPVSCRGTRCEPRSEEHTSELQSRQYLVCRLLL